MAARGLVTAIASKLALHSASDYICSFLERLQMMRVMRDMKLIMESGATKTDCCLLDGAGEICSRFTVSGINVAVTSPETISATVSEAASLVEHGASGCMREQMPEDMCRHAGTSVRNSVSEIVFYGAGIVETQGGAYPGSVETHRDVCPANPGGGECLPEYIRHLDGALGAAFPEAGREYHSDLMAAARGLCGSSPGIVAILGTGSNSCRYDGEKVVENIRPGGFILGDEGSAAALGKMFLADYVKGLLPAGVSADFYRQYSLDYAGVVRLVYGGGSPSRALASLAPYILGMSADEHVYGLVRSNFRNFITRSLLRYGCADEVRVTGSFGVAARDILCRVGSEYGIRFSGFLPGPMEALARWHGATGSSGVRE